MADKFEWVSPYNYAENDPVGCIDLWGLQKVRTQISFRMTTGKVGGKIKVDGYGLEASGYPFGGNSISGGIFSNDYLKSRTSNTGVFHTQTDIFSGSDFTYGFITGGSSESKTTTSENGKQTSKETDFVKEEKAGIGSLTVVEKDNGEKSTNVEIFSAGVNALLIGFEFEISSEITQEEVTQNPIPSSEGSTKSQTPFTPSEAEKLKISIDK